MSELSLEEVFIKIKENLDDMDGDSIADVINANCILNSTVDYGEDGEFFIDKREISLDELYEVVFDSLEKSDGLVTEDLATAVSSCSCDYKGDSVWEYEEPSILNSI